MIEYLLLGSVIISTTFIVCAWLAIPFTLLRMAKSLDEISKQLEKKEK